MYPALFSLILTALLHTHLVNPLSKGFLLDGIAFVGDLEDSAVCGVKLQDGYRLTLNPRVFTWKDSEDEEEGEEEGEEEEEQQIGIKAVKGRGGGE